MQKGLFARLVIELSNAFGGLTELFTDDDSFHKLLNYFRWPDASLPASYQALVQRANALSTTSATLRSEPSYNDLAQLVSEIAQLIEAIEAIQETPTGIDDPNFLLIFKQQLIELLLIAGIQRHLPAAYSLLSVVGVIAPTGEFYTESDDIYESKKINLNNLKLLIKNPSNYLSKYLSWKNDFKLSRDLQNNIIGFVNGIGGNALLANTNADETVSHALCKTLDPEGRGVIYLPFSRVLGGLIEKVFSVSLMPDIAFNEVIDPEQEIDDETGETYLYPDDGPFDELIFSLLSTATPFTPISLNNNLKITFADLSNALKFKIGAGEISFADGDNNPLQTLSLDPAVALDYIPDNPIIFMGEPHKTRLQANGVQLSLALGVYTGVKLKLEATNCQFFIDSSEGDSFLNKVLPNSTVRIPLSLSLSSKEGLRLNNSNSLEVKSAVNQKIGLVSFEHLTIGIESSEQHDVELHAHINIIVTLGSVKVIVNKIGISFAIQRISNPKNISLGFDLPSGVGIAVESDVLKGGGYLFIGPANHRYAGVASLTFRNKLSLNAVGLLQTELPDGHDGYSLALLVTAQFNPLQLGLGFTLNGVGGLVGVNRTIDIPALRSLVRTGGFSSLLFPTNVLDNPGAVLATLDRSFPAAEGTTVLGLMAQIGWGTVKVGGKTYSLLTLDAALLVELPAVRLALLGILRLLLPSPKNPVLKLRADFLGTVDFAAKKIAFDASLVDSSLLEFALTGDMAFRLYHGENPVFLLSTGGFHPSFQPPTNADLPTLRRLTLALANSQDLRIILTSYLALTSNTVQFGSRLDLFVDLIFKFYLEGVFSFDVLFQFNPFHVEAQVSAMVAIKRKGSTKLGIYLGLAVSGPAPWHVVGEASFKVLGIKIKARVNRTFGNKKPEALAEQVDVHALFVHALQEPTNWQVELPTGTTSNAAVLRSAPQQADHLVIDPSGALTFQQKLVPLGYALEKYGNAGVAGPNQFELTALLPVDAAGNAAVPTTRLEETTDFFAPEQFRRMSDAQKLSAPSFQRMRNGYRLRGLDGYAAGGGVHKRVQYERVVLAPTTADSSASQLATAAVTTQRTQVPLDQVIYDRLAKNSASSRSYQHTRPSARAPRPVTWQETTYAVVFARDLAPYPAGEPQVDTTAFANEAQATAYVQQQLASKRVQQGELLVVPTYQLELV